MTDAAAQHFNSMFVKYTDTGIESSLIESFAMRQAIAQSKERGYVSPVVSVEVDGEPTLTAELAVFDKHGLAKLIAELLIKGLKEDEPTTATKSG